MKYLPWILLLVVGVILLIQHDASLKDHVLMQHRADSLDAGLIALSDLWDERLRSDSAAQEIVLQAGAQAAGLHARTDTLTTIVLVADTSFRNRLTDSLKAGFDSLIQQHAQILALSREEIAALHVVIETQASEMPPLLVTIQECREGLAQAIIQRNAAMRQANPPFLLKVLRAIPTAAVFFAVGLLVR